MASIGASTASSASSGVAGALKTFAHEAFVLIDALMSPGQLIDEARRDVQAEAKRIESSDPMRAAVLRRRSARNGL